MTEICLEQKVKLKETTALIKREESENLINRNLSHGVET